MASDRLPSVADMPQISRPEFCAGPPEEELAPLGGSEPHEGGSVGAIFQRFSLASASCTCTPRLLPSSSCHSSTTTIFTLPSTSFASARARRSDRLSGVVTSTVGRRWFCALRSAAAVSPLRAPALQAMKRGVASSLTVEFNTSSGNCNARNVSAASARIGVSHSTVSGAVFIFSVFATVLIAFGARVDCGKAIKDIKAPSQTA